MICNSQKIRELNPLKTIKDERITNNQLILLLREPSAKFSEFNKSNNIFVESKGKVCFKYGDDELQLALSEKSFCKGKKYVEFFLETEPIENSVVIGLCLKRFDYNLYINDPLDFWGYNLSDCKKISYNQSSKYESVKYGEPTKFGDRVGILLEFSSIGLDVSYFINKINMGIAFKNLPIRQYFIAVGLKFNGTRVRILNNVGFPDC